MKTSDAITILETQARSPGADAGSGGGPWSRYWMFSPWQDIAFVVLTPIPILLTFAAAERGAWMNNLLVFGLALAMGHYLPGILRAYGDRALFRRFRVRLILAPLFLFAVTTWFAYRNLHSVILLALLWGQWHWMMQVYGFARIYDAKVKPAARTPARLDQMICVMWFGMCVFVLNNDLPAYLTTFYQSGGPGLPAAAFPWFTRVWLALTIVLTLFYLAHAVRGWRGGRSPNPLKLVFIAVTFAYLSYTVSVIQRPKMGLVMFESWHDIQYLAIVWLFNINRARKSPEAGPFIRFLFRPRAILVLGYVGLCLAFGSLTHAWSLFENPAVVRVVLSLVTATGMLHYYLDGFIWKIRETETSQALGVRAAAEPVSVTAKPSAVLVPVWARHAALWLLFAVPLGVFLVRESKGSVVPPLEMYQSVADAFPDSPQSHYQLGRELQDMGRLREARAHYEQALALAPDLLPAHVFLGVVLTDQRDLAAARAHFERAVRMEPKDAEVRNNLGIVLDEQGDLSAAKAQLELAVSIDPGYALAQNNFGIVLAKLGDLAQARVHHERAVRLSPDFADAHYQLGVTMSRQGDLAAAADHLEQSLRIDPDQYLAHNSLGEVLVSQGKLPEARAHFEQSLRLRPSYVTAKQNLAAVQAAGEERKN